MFLSEEESPFSTLTNTSVFKNIISTIIYDNSIKNFDMNRVSAFVMMHMVLILQGLKNRKRLT